MRYTAREGGGLLRKAVVTNLDQRIMALRTAGSVRLFSVRHEFPSEWARFKNAAVTTKQYAELSITLRTDEDE